jgi:hypothetical protein
MRAGTLMALALIVAVVAVAAWLMVDVRQVDGGAMPDVQIEPGRLPEYDVDVGRVRVDERVEQVQVPKVTTEDKDVRVPVIDVERPEGDDPR